MRTRLIATSILLLCTVGFGLLTWLSGAGLLAKLFGILTAISALFLIFDLFHTIAQALTAFTGTLPDDNHTSTPKPTRTPAHGLDASRAGKSTAGSVKPPARRPRRAA